ncbi:MAG: M23 family metallopeptidase [Deltaproteobacteria bacterium]|nr:M23 family metallopeptidase [Deltaproteobacteria bacterium]MBW2012224.1 M23 family metallopeptidase [Deltaproteobacteria bacterium]
MSQNRLILLFDRVKQTLYQCKKLIGHRGISFFILSYTGSTVKQLTVSRRLLGIISAGFTIFVILSAYVIYDYYTIKTTFNKQEFENKIVKQNDEIVTQRRQIQNFADEINTLKSTLVKLNNFEKKIRIIANIEEPADHDSLFGVGGSIPEDLDSQVPLEEKHYSLMREMHSQTRQLNLASINQQKELESLYNSLEYQRNLLSSTPAIRPTKGWISSGFGYRKSPFTGLREFHKGLDIANHKGTPIIATGDGIVTFVGAKGLLGKVIVIDHGHGMVTRYGHLQEILAKRKQAVKRGDTIALMGNSGRGTGPHLHYEVLLNGIPVNPKKYILN